MGILAEKEAVENLGYLIRNFTMVFSEAVLSSFASNEGPRSPCRSSERGFWIFPVRATGPLVNVKPEALCTAAC